ncbi:hypothetical protein CDV31_002266 [Fusarium ambrosium]|uniref:Uncharacterized protein n=1 Tax=Fusarium ambrosium TaxID=131363 RepID=A0A428UXB1_9HYPO|nr:hypothetical protein CDV31_002266 [Fusarium ambrosium]
MATPPADQSSTTSLQDDIAALEERLWDCEYKINEEFTKRVTKVPTGARKLRDLFNDHKRESSQRHQDLEQNMETVKDRVKVCEEVTLQMDEDMTRTRDRIINLQVEARGVRQTWPKHEKQLDELDIALKNAREEHERDMVELRVALKNAREENEKLSNDLKDFKKTTFTKFEMVFSRLGSQGKESGGGDVDGGDARESEN